MEELTGYYNIYECENYNKIKTNLNKLQKEGKISWEKIDTDIIYLEEIDINEFEYKNIIRLLESNDIVRDDEYGIEDEGSLWDWED